jgi:organic hydroperoxide reductase OsmC/OhrA
MSPQPQQHEEPRPFALDLTLKNGYEFAVDFGRPGVAPLVVDEQPPTGAGRGPSPARLLATAVGHCLASSFLFCVRKSRIDVAALTVHVEGIMLRNERGRLRVGSLRVRLAPGVRAEDRERLGRCVEIFEDFCIVTQSVRGGLDVHVEVTPQT